MLLIYLIAGIMLLAGGYVGYLPWFRVEKLDRDILLNSMLLLIMLFTLLMGAWYIGIFPQWVAAPFMMSVYSLLAGFFLGYGLRLLNLRSSTGHTLYMHRSFWIDHAPNFAVMLVILFGIYRTSVLIDQPVTGIRLTSGLSLIAFGFFGWTLKVVPEFRQRGILFIDRVIPWRQVIGWQWHSEEILAIDYLDKPGEEHERVRELLTSVPAEDRKQIETVLKSKMDDHREAREKLLLMRNERDQSTK